MALEITERIERTERAGIPVFWADLPGPFTAVLAFRAGIADERRPLRGITHLLEHVALSAIGRREHPWNGCVDSNSTVFGAEGERDEVLEFLRMAGAGIREPAPDRVALERGVLRAEAGSYDPGVLGRLLDHRFGASGFGLVNYGELGLRWLRTEDLRAWRDARFTRGNAVVWMTGEPPEDLGIELPEGPRRPQPVSESVDCALPAYVAEGRGGVALTGLGERSTALRAAMHIAGERLYDAVREQRGLAYAPSGGYLELDARTAHAYLGSDCQDEHAPAVLETLWRTVHDLAEHGATEEELDRYRRRHARARQEPDVARGRLAYEAMSELLGDPVLSEAELERELTALDAAALAQAIAPVARTAIVLGPEGCPPPDPALEPLRVSRPEPLTDGEEFTAFSKKSKLTRRLHGGAVLRVSERGLTWEAPEEEPGTLLWERCDLVMRRPSGALVIHQRDGAWMEFPLAGWDAETPFARLEQLIPEGSAIPICDRERFDSIRTVAKRWLEPGAVAYPLLDELPVLLGGDEDLVDVVAAWQWRRYGLLVVTDRRVAWLTYGDEDGFDIPLSSLTQAYGADEQLQLFFDGNVAKVSIDPGDAAPIIAAEIEASRTEPDR